MLFGKFSARSLQLANRMVMAPLTRSRPAMTSSGGLQWTTLFCANDATAATGGRRMGAGETAEVTRLAALQADGGAERERDRPTPMALHPTRLR